MSPLRMRGEPGPIPPLRPPEQTRVHRHCRDHGDDAKVLERMIDNVAPALKMSPAEIRCAVELLASISSSEIARAPVRATTTWGSASPVATRRRPGLPATGSSSTHALLDEEALVTGRKQRVGRRVHVADSVRPEPRDDVRPDRGRRTGCGDRGREVGVRRHPAHTLQPARNGWESWWPDRNGAAKVE